MNLTFGEALIFLKHGKTLARKEWKGKGIGVYLYSPNALSMSVDQMKDNSYIMPHFRIWNKDSKTVNSWDPSICDILADDWIILEKF